MGKILEGNQPTLRSMCAQTLSASPHADRFQGGESYCMYNMATIIRIGQGLILFAKVSCMGRNRMMQ